MDKDTLQSTTFATADDLYNKQIEPQPLPKNEIGIDLDDSIITNIIDTIETSQFDISALNSFTQVSRSRNELYDILDNMGNDSTLASVLETYAEDATETNDQGDIVWCESPDADAGAFVTYLLNALDINKHMYKWTHSLCKYGDVYLRLYRESEYDDLLFSHKKPDEEQKQTKRSKLNEDVKIRYYGKNDAYVHYLEMAPNPAQIFELTRFGKTVAYIKTDVKPTQKTTDNVTNGFSILNRYTFNKNDVDLFQPTEFVHASLEDNTSRTPEEVQLFFDDKGKTNVTYQVKRGQSLLYTTYKIWRQLMLLENSVLLNRVTQSSIVRVIGVEVGDMPKESIAPHLMNIKQLIEQKAALDMNNSMSEYTNPGPIVNNVYIPTRNNQGVLTTQQIGGDVNVGDLADLSYYQDKLFGNLRVPKQFFGITDDNAGFSGGESLSIISSRYAKAIKRIQNTMLQMLTDAINLILINTGNEGYINKFTLRMQAPTTQEEVDRRDNLSNRVSLVTDIMNTLTDIEHVPTKLKILKSLLSTTINDTEVIQLLQDEIDRMEAELVEAETPEEELDEFSDEELFSDDDSLDLTTDELFTSTIGTTDSGAEPAESSDTLPTPAELDIGDVSDATNPAFEG